jgi:hypothetical protein
MSSKFDIYGRPYVLVSEVEKGSVLIADNGFIDPIEEDDNYHCIQEGTELIVKDNNYGDFYVDCGHGKHWIEAQYEQDDEDGTEFYIGFYLKS